MDLCGSVYKPGRELSLLRRREPVIRPDQENAFPWSSPSDSDLRFGDMGLGSRR